MGVVPHTGSDINLLQREGLLWCYWLMLSSACMCTISWLRGSRLYWRRAPCDWWYALFLIYAAHNGDVTRLRKPRWHALSVERDALMFAFRAERCYSRSVTPCRRLGWMFRYWTLQEPYATIKVMQIDLLHVHTLLACLIGQNSSATASNVEGSSCVVNKKAVWVCSTHCFEIHRGSIKAELPRDYKMVYNHYILIKGWVF